MFICFSGLHRREILRLQVSNCLRLTFDSLEAKSCGSKTHRERSRIQSHNTSHNMRRIKIYKKNRLITV